VLSHRSAATLWTIRDGEGPRPDITIPGTTPTRTVFDLAHVVNRDELTRTLKNAQYQRRFNLNAAQELLTRRPSRVFRDLTEDLILTQSELEDRMVALCDRYKLPRPLTQQAVSRSRGRTGEIRPESARVRPDREASTELDSKARAARRVPCRPSLHLQRPQGPPRPRRATDQDRPRAAVPRLVGVTFRRDLDGSERAHLYEEHRAGRSTRLGTGTLACPRCDAPVAPGSAPLAPRDPLSCPYCHHGGAVRDFLSLDAPARPARVEVRVLPGARRAVRRIP
jgi:hypothetical protein